MTARYQTSIATPVGRLRLVATDAALVGVYFPNGRDVPPLDTRPAPGHPILQQAARELHEYFAGRRRAFTTPLTAEGTPFQRQVWAALATIPYGACVSYAEIAARIAQPSAARAVGTANGRNPLPIFVPCHRVVASDGTLGGFGGGLDTKRWLIEHERRSRDDTVPRTP